MTLKTLLIYSKNRLSSFQCVSLLKIDAIFSDYDGTLSPLAVSRELAVIPDSLSSALMAISKRIPFCIVTTKTINYIEKNVPFARAIAGIIGLEIKIGDRKIVDERVYERSGLLEQMCKYSIDTIRSIDSVFVEKRETGDGVLASFCIDWRLTKDWNASRNAIQSVLEHCSKKGLHVMTYSTHPFADAYPFYIDKAEALSLLKYHLNIMGKVMYLGDSENDNPAFEISDVAIGIKHQQVNPQLKCDHSIPFEKLATFLQNLLQSNFNFSPKSLIES